MVKDENRPHPGFVMRITSSRWVSLGLLAVIWAGVAPAAQSQDNPPHPTPNFPHGGQSYHAAPNRGAYAPEQHNAASHAVPLFRPEDRAAIGRPLPVWSGPRHVFLGHGYADFNPYERELWAGGAWRYGWHGDRWGWWWFVGGGWYWYEDPIYPYPDLVSPVFYEGDDEPVMDTDPNAPDGSDSWVPTEVAPGVTRWNPPQYRYYCPELGGYYPQVPNCPSGFVRQAQ
jgi:hypothetical protein